MGQAKLKGKTKAERKALALSEGRKKEAHRRPTRLGMGSIIMDAALDYPKLGAVMCVAGMLSRVGR